MTAQDTEPEVVVVGVDGSKAGERAAHFAGVLFGIVLACFIGVVIIGGIKRITRVTDNSSRSRPSPTSWPASS